MFDPMFKGILIICAVINLVFIFFKLFGNWTLLINLVLIWGLYQQIKYGGEKWQNNSRRGKKMSKEKIIEKSFVQLLKNLEEIKKEIDENVKFSNNNFVELDNRIRKLEKKQRW